MNTNISQSKKSLVNTLIRNSAYVATFVAGLLACTVATANEPAPDPINCLKDGLAKSGTYVTNMHQCLVQKYGAKYNNVAFSLTNDNTLVPDKWIAQTPKVWGMTAEEVGKQKNIGQFLVTDIRRIIASAEHFVDITTLSPFPDATFKNNILAGLKVLAKSGKHVTVRILAGWPQTSTVTTKWTKSYLDFFANPISKIKSNNLSIYVAAQRTLAEISWNHSKIVAVDGKVFITGGENLWTKDYMGATPVHDMNVLIYGSAAYYGHQWANELWKGVCAYVNPLWMPWSWKSGERMDHRKCLAKTNFKKPTGKGNIPVLGVGRYGLIPGRIKTQPSDQAMLMSFRSAKSTIKVSQQDLAFVGNFYWKAGMSEIGQAIARGVDVYVVLSDRGSKGGSNPYSNVSMEKTANALKKYVAAATKKSGSELNNLLCNKMHLTTLRFGPSDTWKGGGTFANHAKFIMVDDAVFYVGSSNMYSSDLQEYGVFIDDPTAVAKMKTDYYDKLWKYSKRAAISGKGVNSCYYKK